MESVRLFQGGIDGEDSYQIDAAAFAFKGGMLLERHTLKGWQSFAVRLTSVSPVWRSFAQFDTGFSLERLCLIGESTLVIYAEGSGGERQWQTSAAVSLSLDEGCLRLRADGLSEALLVHQGASDDSWQAQDGSLYERILLAPATFLNPTSVLVPDRRRLSELAR